MLDTIRLVASRHGLGVHGVHVYEVDGVRRIEMHVEVTIPCACRKRTPGRPNFEEELHSAIPGLEELSPTSNRPAIRRPPAGLHGGRSRISGAIQAVAQTLGVECQPHQVKVHRVEEELIVSFHCSIDPDADVAAAHVLTEQFERSLRARVPETFARGDPSGAGRTRRVISCFYLSPLDNSQRGRYFRSG